MWSVCRVRQTSLRGGWVSTSGQVSWQTVSQGLPSGTRTLSLGQMLTSSSSAQACVSKTSYFCHLWPADHDSACEFNSILLSLHFQCCKFEKCPCCNCVVLSVGLQCLCALVSDTLSSRMPLMKYFQGRALKSMKILMSSCSMCKESGQQWQWSISRPYQRCLQIET